MSKFYFEICRRKTSLFRSVSPLAPLDLYGDQKKSSINAPVPYSVMILQMKDEINRELFVNNY